MSTATDIAQTKFLKDSLPLFNAEATPLNEMVPLHTRFLHMMLGLNHKLPGGFLSLDASHPWMIFWPVNALELLGQPLTPEDLDRVGNSLIACQHPDGGFGGGPGQSGHLAATYAAVMALSYCGPSFWAQIDRLKLVEWIVSLKTDSGGFRVCKHGEVDPRSTYCALAATNMLNCCTDAVKWGVGPYIRSCQTYEGGFANTPLGEAHGGYTFCSLASLFLLNPATPSESVFEWSNVSQLAKWLTRRQDEEVPGFQGRTNKLVDGCYSHWVGGCWALLEHVYSCGGKQMVWNRRGLQSYILKCTQSPQGGLRDKPSTKPDSYHTNYCLCGLSATEFSLKMGSSLFEWSATPTNLTHSGVLPINPVFGTTLKSCEEIHAWSLTQPEFDVPLVTPVAPSTREYQGFALYVGATFVLAIYAAWATLPASWLHIMHIDYYPSRWWAVAVPAFLLMTMVYIYVAVAAYNSERLAFPPHSRQTICDNDTEVHDVPLVTVNKVLYRGGRGK